MLPRGSSRLYGPRVDCEPNVGVGTPATHAQIEQLGGMSPRLDVVLHPKVCEHKKTSHFSVSKKWEAVQLGDGLLLAALDSHARHSRAVPRLRARAGSWRARAVQPRAPTCRAVPRPSRAILYL